MNITWCLCTSHILTTYQIENNILCEDCQKEHAQGLKDRLEKEQKKEEK